MSLMTTLKANKAYRLQTRGQLEDARIEYEQAYAKGLNDPKMLLAFAMLLLRAGDYERTVEVLRKAEKSPGVNEEHRAQIVSYYAVAIWKMGKVERALALLQELFQKRKTGAVYGILGFILIDKAEKLLEDATSQEGKETAKAACDAAVAFNHEAVEYDEDDAICLDNLAQAYYRLLGRVDTARGYFERALRNRPSSIDTNFFLAQIDINEGNTKDAIAKLETALDGRFSPLNFATQKKIQSQLTMLQEKV